MEQIVVRVDGSALGQRAPAWAVKEARIREAELTVVYAWDHPEGYYLVPMEMERAAAEPLRRCLAEAGTDGVTIGRPPAEKRPVAAPARARAST